MSTLDYSERKLDEKRRLTIPAELRVKFNSSAVVTRGFGKYLHLYTKDVWENLVGSRLDGGILDERTADVNVQFRMGQSFNRSMSSKGELRLSNTCCIMQA
jgi:DNA-binding transcriptional regulator/RsmH inhibitor MraZ